MACKGEHAMDRLLWGSESESRAGAAPALTTISSMYAVLAAGTSLGALCWETS